MSRLAVTAAALTLCLFASAPVFAQDASPPPPAEQGPPPLTKSDAATQAHAEQALRTVVEQLRAGAPDFTAMSAEMKAGVEPQVDGIKGVITGLGAVKTVTYLGATPEKAEVFRIEFDKGATEWLIHFGPDGKIDGLFFHQA